MNLDDLDLATKIGYRMAYSRGSREIELRKRVDGAAVSITFESLLADVARLEHLEAAEEVVTEAVRDALEDRRPQW
jgi:hypothetical protein